jgi:flavin reductase (DIM6/NTAB) family NADH-FMN oxidoreductase RutF
MDKIDHSFRKTEPHQLTDNFFRCIGDEWMLITAGTPDKFNTMTASWGAMGILWNKPVAVCFIRPTRYTFGFANESDIFTLSFFTEQEQDILSYCGSHSGRNTNKLAGTGLKPVLTSAGGITFQQARLCIECRKIYYDDLKPGQFLLPDIDMQNYPKKDYHRMFIGEITACYLKSINQ